jgi:hypothetical protein
MARGLNSADLAVVNMSEPLRSKREFGVTSVEEAASLALRKNLSAGSALPPSRGRLPAHVTLD